MKRLIATVCSAALLGGGIALSNYSMAADSDQKTTVQGELIDTYCYSAGDAHGEGHKDCAQKCARSGIPVGVLSDGKVLTIATNPQPLAPYMADQVRVSGEINQQTGVIVPDKVEVQENGQWKEVKMSDAHHGGSEEGEMK